MKKFEVTVKKKLLKKIDIRAVTTNTDDKNTFL